MLRVVSGRSWSAGLGILDCCFCFCLYSCTQPALCLFKRSCRACLRSQYAEASRRLTHLRTAHQSHGRIGDQCLTTMLTASCMYKCTPTSELRCWAQSPTIGYELPPVAAISMLKDHPVLRAGCSGRRDRLCSMLDVGLLKYERV